MKGWSKTTRISVMMALDTVFLAIELGVGYYVSSLALIADAFHMLNDIISLAVGLWAVNLAGKESNDRYSYGWLRAEILGAFFNATFLIGLCVTIVLEAIQRFFDPPEITNPEIVLIVGCFGLASNILGFWVLGGHGHSHGPGEGGHDHDDHDHEHDHDHDHSHSHDHGHGAHAHADGTTHDDDADSCPDEGEEANEEARALLPEAARNPAFSNLGGHGHGRSDSRSSARSRGTTRGRANSSRRIPTTINDISIHPASFRNDIREIIAASQLRNTEDDEDSDDATVGDASAAFGGDSQAPGATETTPLIGNSKTAKYIPENAGHSHSHGASHSHNESHSHVHHHGARARRDSHGGHHHNEPRSASGGHGHSHGDMGMNAMVLHVIGDMLGNIGVIVTALIIWKTNWKYRMYADPIVSLFITLIILKTALPLTKATSKILLQATPDHIDINDIREDIEDLDGVLSCHHVHVWQLSDTQIVASLHIEVAFPISEHGGEKYMALARRVRKCLHGFGIHSATIQPEFRIEAGAAHGHDHDHDHLPGPSTAASTTSTSAALATASTAHPGGVDISGGGPSCLLDCVDDCVGKGCCSINSRAASRTGSPPGSSGNSEHGGHSHAH